MTIHDNQPNPPRVTPEGAQRISGVQSRPERWHFVALGPRIGVRGARLKAGAAHFCGDFEKDGTAYLHPAGTVGEGLKGNYKEYLTFSLGFLYIP